MNLHLKLLDLVDSNKLLLIKIKQSVKRLIHQYFNDNSTNKVSSTKSKILSIKEETKILMKTELTDEEF